MRITRSPGKIIATILLVLLTSLPLAQVSTGPVANAAAASSFSFGAGGDFGILYNSGLVFERVSTSGTSFFLALGDMDYDMSWTDSLGRTYNGGNDADFCRFVTDRLGASYPFEIVSGNHESQGGPDGYVLNHAACLPDRLGSTGAYAAEYYFDYPATEPLMRVVMIAAALTVDNVAYDYWAGNARYLWLSLVIDQARAAGIPWVVVGMHKNCLAIGAKSCEIGPDLMNLLISKRVDLVLQGHDHNYQRGKQLTCATVGVFVGSCVADDGSDNSYPKGAGTIFTIQGMSGRCCYPVNPSDSEAGYLAAWDSSSNGFMKYTVSSQRIDAAFVATTGSYTDSFSIGGAAPPPPPPPPPPPVTGLQWRTVNYDPSFDTPKMSENAGARPADWDYWAPAARNGCGIGTSTSQISGGVLLARQSNPNVTDWNCYGNAVAHQGHFPWMGTNNLGAHCSDQMLGADFDCPRGIHGLQEPAHSDFQLNASWQVSFLSRGSPSGGVGEYNVLAAGFYFYFTDGPVGPLNRRILEAQVRLAEARWSTGCGCWVNEPIGKEVTWDPGFDYGYGIVVAQLSPGQTSTVVDFDLDEFYRKALAKWGLPANTHALLVGIEPGTEGFGAIVNVDFHHLEVEALIPEPARVDVDFDHDVDTGDQTLVQSLAGKCPESDWGVYQWRADADSSGDDPLVAGHSHCVDGFDTSLVSSFLGQNYSELLGAPVLVVPGSQVVNEGQLLQFPVIASDPNPSHAVTLSASGLSSGASFPTVTGNPVTGTFAWTPAAGQAGTHAVTFTAVDDSTAALFSTRTVTVTVHPPASSPPVLSSIGDKAVDEESLLAFTATAIDPDLGQSLTFSLGSGTPQNAVVSATGRFEWTPTEAQGPRTYLVTVTVADSGSTLAYDSETVRITVREVNKPPVLFLPGPMSATIGEHLHFTVSANDPDTPANKVTLGASGLPSDASFDASGGGFSWLVSGGEGEYALSFTATDDGTPPVSDRKTMTIRAVGGGGQPPGEPSQPCFLCTILPSTWQFTIWLLALGGIIGLNISLAVLNARARLVRPGRNLVSLARFRAENLISPEAMRKVFRKRRVSGPYV